VERQVEEIAQLQEFFANKLAEQGDVVTAIRDAVEQSLAHVEKVRVL
jgi:t-SNARE complex subunit (syntaxin)